MIPSVLLGENSAESVNDLLDDFIRSCQLNYAMVCDVQGFVLVFRAGMTAPEPPQIDSLAALIVSNYAANDAIAKLLGDNNFTESMQKGATSGTFIEKINPKLLLVAIFSQHTMLGKTKMKSRQLLAPLAELVEESNGQELNLSEALSEQWGEVNTLMVDKLFEGKL